MRKKQLIKRVAELEQANQQVSQVIIALATAHAGKRSTFVLSRDVIEKSLGKQVTFERSPHGLKFKVNKLKEQ